MANPDLLVGWKAIADFFGVSERFVKNRRKELMNAGVIFYRVAGKPKSKRVCAFKSLLKTWAMLKASKREKL